MYQVIEKIVLPREKQYNYTLVELYELYTLWSIELNLENL